MEAASTAELVDYVRAQLAELTRLTRRRRSLAVLSYLIEMAWLEAEILSQPKEAPNPEAD